MPCYYTKDHEWIDVDGEGERASVGVTDYAQSQLGDITFVELPEPGRVIKQGESIAVVDSVKAASDVFAPASGTVTDINQLLEGEPELVNTSPEESGWLYRLRLSAPDELAGLMDRAAYDAYVAGL
jgi:glycine cleavage system H protein